MIVQTLIIVAATLVLGLVVVEKLPEILRAIADVRAAGNPSLDGLISIDEADAAVTLAVTLAIRRVDPELNDELVERYASTVLEDLAEGRIGPGAPDWSDER